MNQLSVSGAVSMIVRNRLPVFSDLENFYTDAGVILPFTCKSLIPALSRAYRQVPDHSPFEVGFLAVHDKFFAHLDGGILTHCNVSGKRNNFLAWCRLRGRARNDPGNNQRGEPQENPCDWNLHVNIVSPDWKASRPAKTR